MLPRTVDALKRRRRRSVLPRSRRNITLTGLVGILLVAASAGTAVLLSKRSTGVPSALISTVRAEHVSALTLIETAGRTHPFLFLSDVPGSPETKLLAADAAERLARAGGLDLLVVEAPADEQPFLDRYLNSAPENAAILMARPRLMGPSSSAQGMLALYRRVWLLNSELGADRQVRIAALDVSGWPPDVQRPSVTAALYAQRDQAMFEALEKVLARNPGTRVLLLLGSYHVLKSGTTSLKYAGGQPVQVLPLAARLVDAYPGQVYSVLVDAPSLSAAGGTVGTTKFFDLFRRGLSDLAPPIAVPVNAQFDGIREPIYENAVSGIKVDIEPDNYHLREVVDGYVYLGYGRRARAAEQP
jgi:hypothetical protein